MIKPYWYQPSEIQRVVDFVAAQTIPPAKEIPGPVSPLCMVMVAEPVYLHLDSDNKITMNVV